MLEAPPTYDRMVSLYQFVELRGDKRRKWPAPRLVLDLIKSIIQPEPLSCIPTSTNESTTILIDPALFTYRYWRLRYANPFMSFTDKLSNGQRRRLKEKEVTTFPQNIVGSISKMYIRSDIRWVSARCKFDFVVAVWGVFYEIKKEMGFPIVNFEEEYKAIW